LFPFWLRGDSRGDAAAIVASARVMNLRDMFKVFRLVVRLYFDMAR
jgi:hypothetical protein